MDTTIKYLRCKLADVESNIFAYVHQAAEQFRIDTGVSISEIELSFKDDAPLGAAHKEFHLSNIVVNVDIR